MAVTFADVLATLKTVWTGAGSLAGFNGPYRDRLPSGNPPTPFPYVIISGTDADRERTLNTAEHWSGWIYLKVYDDTDAKCETHLVAIIDAIKAGMVAGLPIASGAGKVLKFRCVHQSVREEDHGVIFGLLRFEPEWEQPRTDG